MPLFPNSLHHKAQDTQEQDSSKDTEEKNPGFPKIVTSCREPRKQ